MPENNYSYTNARGVQYFLNTKETEFKNGTMHRIYYFSKDQRPENCPLPEDKEVVENERTGLPFARKKR